VDVVLIPQDGPIRLVLVETKAARAANAACKVIGQLLMYYAGALTFGLDGINVLREFARNFQNVALTIPRKSPQKVLHNVKGVLYPNSRCLELLTNGTSLNPNEV